MEKSGVKHWDQLTDAEKRRLELIFEDAHKAVKDLLTAVVAKRSG